MFLRAQRLAESREDQIRDLENENRLLIGRNAELETLLADTELRAAHGEEQIKFAMRTLKRKGLLGIPKDASSQCEILKMSMCRGKVDPLADPDPEVVLQLRSYNEEITPLNPCDIRLSNNGAVVRKRKTKSKLGLMKVIEKLRQNKGSKRKSVLDYIETSHFRSLKLHAREHAIPMKELGRLIFHVYQGKLRFDAMDRIYGRSPTALPHFLRDFFMQQLGVPILVDKAMHDLLASVQLLKQKNRTCVEFAKHMCLENGPQNGTAESPSLKSTERTNFYLATWSILQNYFGSKIEENNKGEFTVSIDAALITATLMLRMRGKLETTTFFDLVYPRAAKHGRVMTNCDVCLLACANSEGHHYLSLPVSPAASMRIEKKVRELPRIKGQNISVEDFLELMVSERDSTLKQLKKEMTNIIASSPPNSLVPCITLDGLVKAFSDWRSSLYGNKTQIKEDTLEKDELELCVTRLFALLFTKSSKAHKITKKAITRCVEAEWARIYHIMIPNTTGVHPVVSQLRKNGIVEIGEKNNEKAKLSQSQQDVALREISQYRSEWSRSSRWRVARGLLALKQQGRNGSEFHDKCLEIKSELETVRVDAKNPFKAWKLHRKLIAALAYDAMLAESTKVDGAGSPKEAQKNNKTKIADIVSLLQKK